MPKESTERIIDWPYSAPTRGGSVAVGGGGGGGGGATNLDGLSDVTLSGVTNGQTLSYNSGSGQWVNAAPAGMTAHALSGSFHTGLLNWDLINFAGSELDDIVTRPHSMLTGIGPNDHHNQAHVLATGTALGGDHTISGAAAGEVLRASGPTTANFMALHHTDLDTIGPDQHHRRDHNIVTGDLDGNTVHSITGSQFQVVGATATNTLGLLTPTPAPGAAAAILRTDANGGIQLDTNLFYVDGANNWIGINRTPSGATLDVIATANADHTQRIKQKSGQTGRMWRIEDVSGSELIVLDSVGNLQSGKPGFVSGLTGWQITPVGNAEFNNIWARGELHATVFVKDEVHATGGSLLVATAGTLYDDANISASVVDDDVLIIYSTPAGMGVPLQVVTTSGTFVGNELHVSFIGNYLNVNDPPSGPGFYFQPGDIVRSKTEVPTGVTDFWFEINSATQNSGYATYAITKRSGTDGILPKGSALVSYGKEGDGRIILTSDLNYAPYIDVFTVGPNVWTGAAGSVLPRVRLGRLDGVGLPGISGVEQYGMVAGKDLSDANAGYLIASNLQFALYKVDMRLNNGTADTGLWTADGNLKIGSNVSNTATTGFTVYTTGGRSGDVVIGNEATGNYLRWTQASGILQVSGSLVVSDPGTTVTKTYVDAQDAYYDNLANLTSTGYAGIAQTNSQAYADARRITGVTGSWDSVVANQIRWGTSVASGTALTATFANGGKRNITSGTITVGSRTYLYVDVSLAGTLTLSNTTDPAVVAASAGRVLIAVVDPGTPRASVTVVAGTTYISGSNISTGSIDTAQLTAGAVTTAKLDSGVITSINTADAKGQQGIDDAAAALAAAGSAQSAAQVYSNARRVVGVNGTWGSKAYNTIFWQSASVKFANGSTKTLAAPTGSGSPPNSQTFTGRAYFYIVVTAAAPVPVQMTDTIGDIGVDEALIAVADAGDIATANASGGSGFASVSIVAGATYISGDNIITGSIVTAQLAVGAVKANQIDAGAVTAAKISVTSLSAIDTNTGALTVTGNLTMNSAAGNIIMSGGGKIYSSTKSTYASTVAGIFLGYDSGYKFNVGDGSNYIHWTGARLEIQSDWGITIGLDATGTAIRVLGGTNTGQLFFDNGGSNTWAFQNPVSVAGALSSGAITASSSVQGTQLRAVTTASSAALIYLQASGGNDSFTFNKSSGTGVLTYSGQLVVSQNVISTNFISLGDILRITTPRTLTSAGQAGSTGDISWDDGRLYIRTSIGWKYINLVPF